MTRRLFSAVCATVLILGLSAGAALGGEITGNGKLLHTDSGKWGTGLHARSVCAYSGQEDQQFFTDDSQTMRKPVPTKGDPGHAQSWGQIPKAVRGFLTSIGEAPGLSCNPIKGAPVEE